MRVLTWNLRDTMCIFFWSSLRRYASVDAKQRDEMVGMKGLGVGEIEEGIGRN